MNVMAQYLAEAAAMDARVYARNTLGKKEDDLQTGVFAVLTGLLGLWELLGLSL